MNHEPLRIAFIVTQFPLLSETFILNQITGLIDRGHEVDVYADRPSNASKRHPDVDRYGLLERTRYRATMPQGFAPRLAAGAALAVRGFATRPAATARSLNPARHGRWASSLRLLFAGSAFARGARYDVIHAHFGPNGLTTALLREAGAISGPLLTTFHGIDVNQVPKQWGDDYYLPLFARGDLYSVNTNFTADQAKALGCPEEKIVLLSVGLDMARAPFAERSEADADAPRVITVGRLEEKKGIEYSIRAFAKATRDRSGARYTIIGEGGLRGELKALIKELGVGEKVELVGSKTQDEVRALYAASHVFVLASVTAANGDREGQGLVIQEAQAMGLPVLTTDHNGIPDGLIDGESGFLVPERDVAALAERLTFLLDHPECWAPMGRAGREFVEERYDINRLNDRLVEIYRGMA